MSHHVANFIGPIIVAVISFGAGAALSLGLVAELREADRRSPRGDR